MWLLLPFVAIAPWYWHLFSLITQGNSPLLGWLNGRSDIAHHLWGPLSNLASVAGATGRAMIPLTMCLGIIACGLLWKPGALLPRRQLLYLIVVLAFAGPFAIDLVKGSHTALITRYTFGALPAVMILLGVGLTKHRLPIRSILVSLVIPLYLFALRDSFWFRARGWEPFQPIGAFVAQNMQPNDVVVSQAPALCFSLGIARYSPANVLVTAAPDWSVPYLDTTQIIGTAPRALLVQFLYRNTPTKIESFFRTHMTLPDHQPELEQESTHTKLLLFEK